MSLQRSTAPRTSGGADRSERRAVMSGAFTATLGALIRSPPPTDQLCVDIAPGLTDRLIGGRDVPPMDRLIG